MHILKRTMKDIWKKILVVKNVAFTRYAGRFKDQSTKTLSVEKIVVGCIPHPYSADPEKLVVVVHLLDSCLEHKSINCTDFFKTTIVLK